MLQRRPCHLAARGWGNGMLDGLKLKTRRGIANWAALALSFGPMAFWGWEAITPLDCRLRPLLGRWALDGAKVGAVGVTLLAFLAVHATLAKALGLEWPYRDDRPE